MNNEHINEYTISVETWCTWQEVQLRQSDGCFRAVLAHAKLDIRVQATEIAFFSYSEFFFESIDGASVLVTFYLWF